MTRKTEKKSIFYEVKDKGSFKSKFAVSSSIITVVTFLVVIWLHKRVRTMVNGGGYSLHKSAPQDCCESLLSQFPFE